MPPNLLFLLVDCLRADRAAAGQTFAHTPHIDRLRHGGTAFTQAIAAATTTTPCVSTILTGCYPATHGVRSHSGYKLSPRVSTLAETLAGAGYRTWACATGPLAPEVGAGRSFHEYEFRDRGEYLDGRWGEALRRRIAEETAPWFGFVHLWELHLPRRARPGFERPEHGATMYDRALSALDEAIGRLLAAAPAGTLVVLHGDHGEQIEDSVLGGRWFNLRQRALGLLTPGMRRRGKALLNRLPRTGESRNPMEKIGHGFHVYEPLVRVPLILAGADIPAGVTVPDQVRQVDIAPTLAEALGVRWPGPLDGRSLLPLVRGETLPELPAFSEACGAVLVDPKWWRSGIRTGGYKFVYGPNNPGLPEELYDLRADPDERHSLAAERPDLAARLKAQIEQAAEAGLGAEPEQSMSDEEMAVVEKRLQELGYLE